MEFADTKALSEMFACRPEFKFTLLLGRIARVALCGFPISLRLIHRQEQFSVFKVNKKLESHTVSDLVY